MAALRAENARLLSLLQTVQHPGASILELSLWGHTSGGRSHTHITVFYISPSHLYSVRYTRHFRCNYSPHGARRTVWSRCSEAHVWGGKTVGGDLEHGGA